MGQKAGRAVNATINTVGGYLTLNVLWLLSVLLVFTSFAGTAAAFRVIRSWSRSSGTDPYCARPFLLELREAFAQATRIGLLLLASWGLLILGAFGLARISPGVPIWLLIALPAVLLAGATAFIWPVQADYDIKDRLLWRTASILGMGHPLVLATSAAIGAGGMAIVISAPVTALLLPAPMMAACYAICHRALNKSLSGRSVAAPTVEGRNES